MPELRLSRDWTQWNNKKQALVQKLFFFFFKQTFCVNAISDSSETHFSQEAAALILHRRAAVIPPGSSLPSSQQMIRSRIQLESAQKQSKKKKFIQTWPQHSLSSLSKNFQRLEGQCCRQLPGRSNKGVGWGVHGGVEPAPGPGPPLLSVAPSPLCYCFDWGRGMSVRGWGGSRGVRPSLFCLSVLESRSWLDLTPPPTLPSPPNPPPSS